MPTYYRDDEAKKRSQFPPYLFDVFQEVLKVFAGRVTLLLRSEYGGYFEPRIRDSRLVATTAEVPVTSTQSKGIKNKRKNSNHPITYGTQPLQIFLRKVDNKGNILDETPPTAEELQDSLMLVRSIEHVIAGVHHGIYKIVTFPDQDPKHLFFRVNAFYKDKNEREFFTNIPFEAGDKQLFRLDLTKSVDQIFVKSEGVNDFITNPIASVDELETLKQHEIVVGENTLLFGELFFFTEVKEYNTSKDFEPILIAASDKLPIISDIDCFGLLFSADFFPWLAQEYNKHTGKTPDTEISADQARDWFNGLILTEQIKDYLGEQEIPELFTSIEGRLTAKTISVSKALEAIHFLLYLFNPERPKKYDPVINPEELTEIERVLEDKGFVRPFYVFLLLLFFKRKVKNLYPQLGELFMHGAEVDNVEYPQDIGGVTWVGWNADEDKLEAGLSYGASNLAIMLKDFSQEKPCEMLFNPALHADWNILENELAASGTIRLVHDSAMSNILMALQKSYKSLLERRKRMFLSEPDLSASASAPLFPLRKSVTVTGGLGSQRRKQEQEPTSSSSHHSLLELDMATERDSAEPGTHEGETSRDHLLLEMPAARDSDEPESQESTSEEPVPESSMARLWRLFCCQRRETPRASDNIALLPMTSGPETPRNPTSPNID